jgi:hypothetical protein
VKILGLHLEEPKFDLGRRSYDIDVIIDPPNMTHSKTSAGLEILFVYVYR